MHALLIHQAFVSPNEAGGTRHFELGRRLIESGHEFTIIAGDRSYLTGRLVQDSLGSIEPGRPDIRIRRAWTLPGWQKSYLLRVSSFLLFMVTCVWTALRVRSVDVVMGTSPPIFQAVSAWFVAFVKRRPFLLEIRDLWPEFAIDIGLLKNPLLIMLARGVERFLYWRATHILVNSPAYRDYLIERGVAPDRISFIPNGVDPKMFESCDVKSDPDASFRSEFGLGDRFVVTYAGAVGMANDIDTILFAADQLRDEKNIHFMIVGDGKERPRLQEQVDCMELTNVTFAGARPKSEMPEVLRSSDACIATLKNIPMFRTTYPNKVFDYMAASRPVLLAIDGVIREVVESGRAGVFVPPGDAKALAESVLRLARNRHEARAMGKSGREYVRNNFNRDVHAVELRRLIDRVAFKRAA